MHGCGTPLLFPSISAYPNVARVGEPIRRCAERTRDVHRYYWCGTSRRPLIPGPRGSFSTLSEIIVVSWISVFRNVALNAIAIGLQFAPQCLKVTDEIVDFAHGTL